MKSVLRVLTGAVCVCASTFAGVTFNLSYDPSLSAFGGNQAALQSATQYVADEFSGLFSNNVTVNILVTASNSGLGSSLFEFNGVTYDYAQIRAALLAHASTPESLAAVNSLPLLDPTGGAAFHVPNAQAKALGLIPANNAGRDGTFYIGTGYTYTFDPLNRTVPGAFDFIGVAEHEISELMGRSTQLTNPGFGYLPFDLFRYTSAGVIELNPSAASVYFSADGGATFGRYYNALSNGGDVQDWAAGQTSSFNAFVAPGQAGGIAALDVTVMNTLGWETAVPEPATVALMLAGLASLAAGRHRRSRRV